MVSFYERVKAIQPRPGVYLGSKSIASLYLFFEGYKCALRDLAVDSQEAKQFEEFYGFVNDHYNIKLTDKGWATIILEHSFNEEEAVDTFFTLFDSFLQQKQKAL